MFPLVRPAIRSRFIYIIPDSLASMADLPSPLIDILSTESFAEEHLPGAVNICVYEVAFIDKIRAAFPNPNTPLTIYGLNDATHEAESAVEKLAAAGYRQVQVLPGGLEGWKAKGGKVEPGARIPLPEGRFEIDQAASVVEWMGRNLFNHHLGTVRLGSGSVLIKNGQLAGGRLSIDMTTLQCTDIPDPVLNAHLIAHLKSDDFFSVDKYPRADLALTDIIFQAGVSPDKPNYQVAGDFTLRGVTNRIDFPVLLARKPDGSFTAQGVLDIDRTLWEANYGSAKLFGRLGQHLVNDEVHLHLKVVTKGKPAA
ncbi:MAG TPA: YceI family protein [Chthoniobacterales bacterium]|nr:YceI family protein [Chthoniobacterales bacterium]